MNVFYEYREPSLLKFKAAVFGHLPAETGYHNNAKATELDPHNLVPFLDRFLFTAFPPCTLRWADDRGLTKADFSLLGLIF